MKRLLPCFLILASCACTCFASLSEAHEAADGYLTEGEYDGGGVTLEHYDRLFVMGGGAYEIAARNSSYLEVQYTSTPLGYQTGIYDIILGDESRLLYLNGVTEEITIGNHAHADLKGGRVDYITIGHLAADSCSATIYCQDGWQWLYASGQKKGITGLWENGSEFTIQFINVGGIFPPTANYINVVEVMPEPITLALLSLGALLVRRKQ